MELLFRARTTPIAFISVCNDVVRVMSVHPLNTPDWMLLRLAVVIINVAAVALIVAFARSLKRWWRRPPGAASSPNQPRLPALTGIARGRRYAGSRRATLSRSTAAHRALR
jgi:hypothetical protein